MKIASDYKQLTHKYEQSSVHRKRQMAVVAERQQLSPRPATPRPPLPLRRRRSAASALRCQLTTTTTRACPGNLFQVAQPEKRARTGVIERRLAGGAPWGGVGAVAKALVTAPRAAGRKRWRAGRPTRSPPVALDEQVLGSKQWVLRRVN
ncbi:Protein of unknown function [Gryllus bimaculatus]|nr:Protein of unknown function [Gryllus bimaculatus]